MGAFGFAIGFVDVSVDVSVSVVVTRRPLAKAHILLLHVGRVGNLFDLLDCWLLQQTSEDHRRWSYDVACRSSHFHW